MAAGPSPGGGLDWLVNSGGGAATATLPASSSQPSGNASVGSLGADLAAGPQASPAPAVGGSGGGMDWLTGGGAPANPPPDAPPSQTLKIGAVPKNLNEHPLLGTVEGNWKGTYSSSRAMQLALEDARKNGLNIKISSAMRSRDEQASLYASMPAGMAAAPGHSNHEKGIAYDLAGDVNGFEKYAQKFGFARPLDGTNGAPNEPWHYTFQQEATPGSRERVWGADDSRLLTAQQKMYPPASPQRLAQNLGQQHGFSPEDVSVMMRQLGQESSFNPKAVSPTGALGIPQFMPGTLAPLMNKRGLKPSDYTDNPSLQMDIYFEYMQGLLKKNGGNWARTLTAYNAGPAADPVKAANYPETRDYVSRILGVPPEQASQMIASGTGPSSIPADPGGIAASQQLARQRYYDDAKKILNTITGGAPDIIATGLSTAQLQQGRQGMSKPAIMAEDFKETGRTALRGLTMGIPATMAWIQKHSDNGNIDPASVQPGDENRSALAYAASKTIKSLPFIGNAMSSIDYAPIAKFLEPSEWQKPEQDYINNMRHGQDFMNWGMGVATGKNDLRDPDAWVANALSLGRELPSIAGNIAATELIAPGLLANQAGAKILGSQGITNAARAAGAPADWVLQRLMPGASARIGPEFFRQMAAVQSVMASQMGSQAFGDALQAGKSPQEAAVSGLTNAVAGAFIGSALHMGIPAFGGLFSSSVGAAKSAAEAAGAQATPVVQAALAALKNPTNDFVLAVSPSLTKLVQMVDKQTGGALTRAVQASATMRANASNSMRELKIQNRMVQAMTGQADKADQATHGLETWAHAQEQQIQNTQQTLQTTQQSVQSFLQSNPMLLANPVFQQAVNLKSQLLEKFAGEISNVPEGMAPNPMETGRELKKLLNQLDPADQAAVNQLAVAKQVTATAQQRLQQLQQQYTPEIQNGVANDLTVYQWMSSSLRARGEALANKAEAVGIDAFEHWLPDNLPPQNTAIQKEIISQFNTAVDNLIEDGGSMISLMPTKLMQQVTQTTRGLLDNISTIGNPAARMERAADDLQRQLVELKATPPQKPEAPLRPKYADPKMMNKYTSDKAGYDKEMVAWKAQVVQHKQQLQDLAESHGQAMQHLQGAAADLRPTADLRQMSVAKELEAARGATEQQLRDAGLTKGSAQLDGLYKPEKQVTAEEMGDFWKKTKRTRLPNAAADADLEAAAAGGHGYIKVDVPSTWIEAAPASAKKVAGIEASAKPPLNRDLTENPMFLGEPGSSGNLSVIDGKARAVVGNKLGKDTMPAFVREDTWNSLLKSKLGTVSTPGSQGWSIHDMAKGGPKYDLNDLVHGTSAENAESILASKKFDASKGTRQYSYSEFGPDTIHFANGGGFWASFTPGDRIAEYTHFVGGKIAPGANIVDINSHADWDALAHKTGFPDGRALSDALFTDQDLPETLGQSRSAVELLKYGGVDGVRISKSMPHDPDYPTPDQVAIFDPSKVAPYKLGAQRQQTSSPSATINEGILSHANAVIDNLSPEDAAARMTAQMQDLAEAFYGERNPSAKRLQEVYTNEKGEPIPQSDWTKQLPSGLHEALESITGMRATLGDWLKMQRKGDIGQMLSRSEQSLRDWQNTHSLADTMAAHLGTFFQGKLQAAIEGGSVKLTAAEKASYMRTKQLPQTFGEPFADAVQGMITDPQKMQQFLQKNPGMRDVIGAHFGMMSLLEQYKVSSPDLGALFNRVSFPHRFPEMAQISSALNDQDLKATIGITRLMTEEARKIETLAEARKLYGVAKDAVLGGNWEGVNAKYTPVTPEKRLQRFVSMTQEDKMKLTGLSADEVNSTTFHLGLRNPVTDPVQLMTGQVQSVLKADATRSLIRQLANLPIPGMGMRLPTGRPYSVVEHFPRGAADILDSAGNPKLDPITGKPMTMAAPDSPPLVPTMLTGNKIRTDDQMAATGIADGQRARTMVPLSGRQIGLAPDDYITFMGVKHRADELFIHPDVAEIISKYHTNGEIDASAWAQINQLTRTGQLALGGAPHLININSAHMGQLAGYSLSSIAKSIKDLTSSALKGDPAGAAAAFKQMGSSTVSLAASPFMGPAFAAGGADLASQSSLMCDAILHGANLDVWNSAVSGLSRQAAAVYREAGLSPFPDQQPKNGLAQSLSNITKNQSFGEAWNEARTGQMLGIEKMEQMAALPFTAVKALEHYSIFQPIQDALVGAYAFWTHAHWNDMGEKLVKGGIPTDVALKMVKGEAAELVNKLSGALQSYTDPASVRNKMYSGMTGQLVLSPGWLRTKVHTLTSAMPDFAPDLLKARQDYATMADSPELRNFAQSQARWQIGALITGGWTGAQALSMIINNHLTTTNDPGNPAAAFKLKVGSKLYPIPTWGPINTYMTALGRTGKNDILAVLSEGARDQMQALPRSILDIASNRDFAGAHMRDPESGPFNTDSAKYLLHNSLNLDPILGDPAHYQTKTERALGVLGFHPSQAPSANSEAGQLAAEEKFQYQQVGRQIRKPMETYLLSNNADERSAAIKNVTDTALKAGWDGDRIQRYMEGVVQSMPQTSDINKAMHRVHDPLNKAKLLDRVTRMNK